MSTLHTQISLINKTGYTLSLQPQESSGIDTSVWPAQLEPNAQPSFPQGWDVQIKFVAVYEYEDASIGLDFYGDAFEVFDCKIEEPQSGVFAGSTAQNNGPMFVTFTIDGQP